MSEIEKPQARHGLSTSNLPAASSVPPIGGGSGALIEKIGRAVTSEITHHIQSMYPDAAKAVAWGSCKRSLSGVVYNTMVALNRAAVVGNLDGTIAEMAANRRAYSRMQAANRTRTPDATTPEVAAPSVLSAAPSVDGAVFWQHKKRGTLYRLLMRGTLQIEGPQDMAEVVVYQDVDDGRVWVRPASEFFDGRFEEAPVSVRDCDEAAPKVAEPAEPEAAPTSDEAPEGESQAKARKPVEVWPEGKPYNDARHDIALITPPAGVMVLVTATIEGARNDVLAKWDAEKEEWRDAVLQMRYSPLYFRHWSFLMQDVGRSSRDTVSIPTLRTDKPIADPSANG